MIVALVDGSIVYVSSCTVLSRNGARPSSSLCLVPLISVRCGDVSPFRRMEPHYDAEEISLYS